jgi:hypothetical protein
LIVTVTPDNWSDSGTEPALKVAGASPEPKIDMASPGAKVWRKDAPFPTLVIVGTLEADDVTVTVTDPLAALNDVSPLYCAAMESTPTESRAADTVSVAVADPPDPVKLAEPSATLLNENATVPVGVPPLALDTVAVTVALPDAGMELALAVTVMLGVGREIAPPEPLHAVIKVFTSTEPRPLA